MNPESSISASNSNSLLSKSSTSLTINGSKNNADLVEQDTGNRKRDKELESCGTGTRTADSLAVCQLGTQ